MIASGPRGGVVAQRSAKPIAPVSHCPRCVEQSFEELRPIASVTPVVWVEYSPDSVMREEAPWYPSGCLFILGPPRPPLHPLAVQLKHDRPPDWGSGAHVNRGRSPSRPCRTADRHGARRQRCEAQPACVLLAEVSMVTGALALLAILWATLPLLLLSACGPTAA